MTFSTSHHLGPDPESVDDTPRINLGTVVRGDDGYQKIYVKASAAIAAAAAPGTQVTVTAPAMTAATGAGGWYAPPSGVASGKFFWANKNAI